MCGNSFGKYGMTDNSNCYKKCSSNSGQYCGGPWLNSVYRSGKFRSEFFSSENILLSTAFYVYKY